MFAMMNRYELPFSIVILDIDHFKKSTTIRAPLRRQHPQSVAKLLDDNVRDTDVVTRYGGEEFVIVMPQTPLAGAAFSATGSPADRADPAADDQRRRGQRGRRRQSANAPRPGRRRAVPAKAAGRNRVFYHTGMEL